MLKKQTAFILLICCVMHATFAAVIKTEQIVEDTPNHTIQINYPQGFTVANVNKEIKLFVQNLKEIFEESKENKNGAVELNAKNSLTVTYTIPYQNKNALSVLFDVSTYHRGYAHPYSSQHSYNYLKGKKISLSELFLDSTLYIKELAKFSRDDLNNKLSDQLIEEGLEPRQENYDTWYFTPDGLALVFHAAQVAPYYMGVQVVTIPKSALKNQIKPEVFNAVWG